MANKPATLCQLEKGKLISLQDGFVDTFNWAVNAIANLNGGQNCEVNWTVDDQPTIDCNVSDSSPNISAVLDVVSSTSESQSGIEIQYVDARPVSFIPFGGGGEVSFIGTDNTVTSASSQFRLSKAANSNVVVTASGTTLTIGVYYI